MDNFVFKKGETSEKIELLLQDFRPIGPEGTVSWQGQQQGYWRFLELVEEIDQERYLIDRFSHLKGLILKVMSSSQLESQVDQMLLKNSSANNEIMSEIFTIKDVSESQSDMDNHSVFSVKLEQSNKGKESFMKNKTIQSAQEQQQLYKFKQYSDICQK